MQTSKELFRVLLVGESALHEELMSTLRSHDYLVDRACGAEEALVCLLHAERPYNVVVISEMTPARPEASSTSSTIRLVQRIKSGHSQTEFIILKHNGTESAVALLAGESHCLSSPLDPTELVNLIDDAIRFAEPRGASLQKQVLERLVEMSAATLNAQTEQEVLDSLVRSIHAIGFDRVGLYLLSDDEDYFVGSAHVGMREEFTGSEWRVADDPYLQALLHTPHLSVCSRADAKLASFETVLVREGVDEWACVPVVLRGRVIGHIVADNSISADPILREDLDPIALFTSQAATAIESARLYSEVERKAKNLNEVLELSRAVNSTLELEQTLTQACRSAVELLEISHSGIVLFEEGFERGTVRAEYPARGTKGLSIEVSGVPLEERLIRLQQPIVIENLAEEQSFGPVGDRMLELGISSVLIVPIVNKGHMLGSFGLDVFDKTRRFTKEEIELCQVFAAQVASAIANAQLFALTSQRADELEALRRATKAITSQLDRDILLDTIIDEAIKLLKAKGGGIYSYDEELGLLEVIIDHNRPDRRGIQLNLGEGAAGRLVRDKLPFIIVDDYNNWKDRAKVYCEIRPYGSVVEVPLIWQERIIGVVYIEDEVGTKKFTQENAELLALFADQAAIALVNADFILRDQEKLRRLEKLSRTTKEIVGNLEATSLDERLDLIAERAADILEAETCGIFLMKDGELSLEASHGHREGGFKKGKRFSIQSGPHTGLTGHIAFKRRMFKAHGDELRNLPVVRGVEAHHGPSDKHHSLLAIPLIKNVEGEETLVGLLRVDNKKDKAGRPRSAVRFREEDESILNIFAEAVVVAIESSELVDQLLDHRDQLNEQKNLLEFLLTVSNLLAKADKLNEGLQSLAELMATRLGHTFCRVFLREEGDSLLVVKAAYPHPQSRKELDWDPRLGKRIAHDEWLSLPGLLRAGKPWVRRLENDEDQTILNTFSDRLRLADTVQSLLSVPLGIGKNNVGLLHLGEIRPDPRQQFTQDEIDLAEAIAAQATVLIDRLRFHEATELRENELKRLHDAAQRMSGESGLKQVLKSVVITAQEMMRGASATVWPFDVGSGKFIPEELETEGIPPEYLDEFRRLDPQPAGITFTIKDTDWTPVPNVDGSPEEFPYLQSPRRELLKRIGIRSFQGIPLKVGREPIGVLYVNYNHLRSFGDEDQRSMTNLARYAALSVKKARLLDRVTKSKKTAKLVAEVMVVGNREDTLSQVAKGTLDTLGCDAVNLYVYDQDTNRCDHPPTMAGDLDREKVSRHEAAPGSLVYAMLQQEKPYVVEEVDRDPYFKETRFAREEKIESCVAIPLRAFGGTMGVMFVNYRRQHRFGTDELDDIELFANQAAVAIRNNQLFKKSEMKLRHQRVLVELSQELLGTVDLQKIWDRAVSIARDALGTACGNIVLPDKHGDLYFVAQQGWDGVEVGKTRLESGKRSQTGFTIERRSPIDVIDYRQETQFVVPPIVFENNLVSGLSVPMFSGHEVVGAILVHTKTHRLFDNDEKTLLSLIANQTAIAMNVAAQYKSLERKSAYLSALYEAGKVINASSGLRPRDILHHLVEQAVKCVISGRQIGYGFGTIQLFFGATNELQFESFYSPHEFIEPQRELGDRRSLSKGRIGISGRAILSRTPQRVADVRQDTDYLDFHPGTRSEMDIPLIVNDTVLGVLNLEMDQLDAFDDDDLNTLEALGELAAIAIHNFNRYEVLKQAKETRTALARLGIASALWGHDVLSKVVNINDQAEHLRPALNGDLSAAIIAELKERVAVIEHSAKEILEKPIKPMLSPEDGSSSVAISQLVDECTSRLWKLAPYNAVSLRLDLTLPKTSTARVNAQILRLALDELILNAVRALAATHCSDKLVTVATRLVDGCAEIAISDNGPGIPPELQAKLLKEPIKKPASEQKLGMGLLVVHAIVETYSGDLRIEQTSPDGTTMVIKLPLEP